MGLVGLGAVGPAPKGSSKGNRGTGLSGTLTAYLGALGSSRMNISIRNDEEGTYGKL